MLSKLSPLLIAGLSASSTAQLLARLVPQALEERAVAPAGGWALTAPICPNDLDVCGNGWCCPTSLTCGQAAGYLSNICCAGTINCIAAFKASPYCADDTWSLWDKTRGGIDNIDYFCCAPGQVGLLDGTCIASDAISSPTQEALALAPGGQVLSTAPGSTSTTIVSSTSTAIVSTSAVVTTVSETSTVPSSTTSVVVVSSSAVSSSNSTTTKSSSNSTSIAATASTSLLTSKSTVSASSSATPSSTKSSEGTKYESFGPLLFIELLAGLFAVNMLLG